MNLTFPDRPATMMFASESRVGIFKKITLVPEGIGGVAYKIRAEIGSGEFRQFPIISIDQVASNYWVGKSYPGSVEIIIRPTTESDVMNSITASSDMALPLEVIESLLEPVNMTPTLYALSEDDGFVATMMLSSDVGMYMRYSGQWHKLNPDAVDGLNVTEMDGPALDMFDQFDRAGQLVHVDSMPRSANNVPVAVGLDSSPSTDRAVTAAAVIEVPQLNSEDDVESAIAAAADEPEIRWWVERRLKAMGIETELPWSDQ